MPNDGANVGENMFNPSDGMSCVEDEDDDEEIFQAMMTVNDQVHHTIKSLDTPVKNEDEYLIFRKIFNTFKETKYERLQYFCSNIDERTRSALKIIVQSKRVEGTNNVQVPRKIVTVKKKVPKKMELN